MKVLVKDKKLETLLDPNLLGNRYIEEVEELIQVALICTQKSPYERPKMSEVVRMLEGEGLEEKWDESSKSKEVLLKEKEFEDFHDFDTLFGKEVLSIEKKDEGHHEVKKISQE